MKRQIEISEEAIVGDKEGRAIEVGPDLAYLRVAIVNVAFIGAPGGKWFLVDGGIKGGAGRIRRAAEERYGKGARPEAILMTHGHFDHVGALRTLAEDWGSPIYAHELEVPYLDGSLSYPEPDPSVGGGMMAATSPLFPRGPFEFRKWLQVLPSDSSVPGLADWVWIHTPGHTEGHVAFWRERDRALIAGDAFITTRQESAYAVLAQKPEVHGPPMYYTPDWESAAKSVRTLAELEPEIAITGHGRAMGGGELRDALRLLADDFWSIAVPERGKYVPGEHIVGRG